MVLGSDNAKPNKQWIHSPENLLGGKVTYSVKFIGKAEVPEPRGMPMVKMALQKLSFSRQIKRSEGMKPPKVELGINIQSVSIVDFKTKALLHNIGLHRVSFCADDKEDKRLFAFIAKLDDNKHYCYGLDSFHQANDITLTIGQAFELAYDKFMKDNPTTTGPKKVGEMSKRIQQLESENNELRRRIAELETVKQNDANSSPLVETILQSTNSSVSQSRSNPVVPPRNDLAPTSRVRPQQEAIDAFNMQPFVPTNSLTRLPQPPSRKPVKQQDMLWSSDPFDSITKTNKPNQDIMDMQNQFSSGMTMMSEENVTLDSFDPLKH